MHQLAVGILRLCFPSSTKGRAREEKVVLKGDAGGFEGEDK